jgi:integrative and conjugative element protein (TIGR02256 family)
MASHTHIAWISQTSLEVMIDEACRASPNETGGILLGYWDTSGDQVVITEVTQPGPRAHHDIAGFVPDDDFQEREIERVYAESGRRHVYLGDWHTHPNGTGLLSWKDKKTLRAIASYAPARAITPLMAVLAGGPSWKLHLWTFLSRDSKRLKFFSRITALHLRQY